MLSLRHGKTLKCAEKNLDLELSPLVSCFNPLFSALDDQLATAANPYMSVPEPRIPLRGFLACAYLFVTEIYP